MKFIKNTFCVCLVVILLVHSSYLLLYYTLYKVNVKQLTESCCKKKVENCNAHCFLDDKMNQGSNDANKDKATVELKLKVSEFVIEFSDFKIIPSAIHKYPFPEIRKILIGIPSELDHPPQI